MSAQLRNGQQIDSFDGSGVDGRLPRISRIEPSRMLTRSMSVVPEVSNADLGGLPIAETGDGLLEGI